MIFIDTSAFIALSIKDDTFHSQALRWWEQQFHKEQFLTSNLIISETLGWLRYQAGVKVAVAVGKRLFFSKEMQIERVNYKDEQDSWSLFQKRSERGLSMIDAASVVLCKRLRIKTIFGFDQDFIALGLHLVP